MCLMITDSENQSVVIYWGDVLYIINSYNRVEQQLLLIAEIIFLQAPCDIAISFHSMSTTYPQTLLFLNAKIQKCI